MRWLALVPLIMVMACDEGLSPEEQAARDARDIAAVEAGNARTPPARPITPQVIGYPDIEKYNLFGAGCSFAPGDSMGAIVLAQDDTAYIKLDDDLVRFASDSGSSELPMGTRTQYDGKEYQLELALERDKGTISGEETMNYPGFAIIRDANDQVVYQADGTMQCGA
jgi:hypothetical protein